MLSITYKAVVVSSNRRKDGTYPVKIRLTFKGVSRRLSTTLVARPSDLTRSLHIKSPEILQQADKLISEMRATTAVLSYFVLEGWDVDRVVAHIRNELAGQTFRLDFFKYADGYLAGKNASTRRAYDSALRSLERFVGKRELDINDISKKMLLAWKSSNDSGNKMHYRGGVWRETTKPQAGGQPTRHLDKIAHIFRAAQTEYNDDERVLIPKNPFAGIPKNLPPAQGQHNLGAELMQRIIDAETFGVERVALDLFILSFCLMGANLADLWDAREVGPEWVYNRRKTKNRRADRAEMRVVVPPEARPILERLGAKETGVWLPALHRLGTTTDRCTAKINSYLRRWAAREGVEGFTFYAARHTWASLARKAGVEKATIDECLCHIGDFKMTDIYAERDYGLMNAANRRTLAVLQFPG